MKKHPGRALVCILLCLTLTTGALAASPKDMTDISRHWARDAIYYCMVEGLFNGATATEFQPDGSMTRAMFVTLLGRMAGIDPEEYRDTYLTYIYDDVSASAWYAPYVCWATRYGIAGGVGEGCFTPDAPLTREQLATMIVRYASIYNYVLSGSGETIPPEYADASSIASYAAEAVDMLRRTGNMTGSIGADGAYYFSPKAETTRAQCATLASRLSRTLTPYTGRTVVPVSSVAIAPYGVELRVGDFANLTATVSPSDATNQTLTWYSTDKSVVKVENGVITALAEGSAEVCAVTYNGRIARCTVTVRANSNLAYAGESVQEKYERIFGQVVDDYKGYYSGNDGSHTVWISVPVWKFTDSSHTTKYATNLSLQVHANIADTVLAIFTEIFNGPEQFPIYSVGGYRPDRHSQHTAGLAIDINADENCEMERDPATGQLVVTTGLYWKPGVDPYSIPADGDVVRAFKKYGFQWGGDWRTKKDYMHFNYFFE